MIPLLKPKLPEWEQLRDYISQSECRGHYSNFGPCHDLLIECLSNHYSVDTGSLCLFSSATSALSLLILYYKELSHKARFTVAIPSWTFSASAHAVKSVGADVIFFDTDNQGFLDLDAIEIAFHDNDDLIDAIATLVTAEKASNKFYNIGTSVETTIDELASVACDLVGLKKDEIVRYVPHSVAIGSSYEDIPRRVPNTDLAEVELNWKPRVTLEQGVKLMYDYINKNDHLDSRPSFSEVDE